MTYARVALDIAQHCNSTMACINIHGQLAKPHSGLSLFFVVLIGMVHLRIDTSGGGVNVGALFH